MHILPVQNTHSCLAESTNHQIQSTPPMPCLVRIHDSTEAVHRANHLLCTIQCLSITRHIPSGRSTPELEMQLEQRSRVSRCTAAEMDATSTFVAAAVQYLFQRVQ